ncbi:MAG: hypothetical protein KJT03_09870, partial [Verrucomicrobiae bacterium]|nr:hypothetical protein [Verrucomicrobiae bacterium]
MTHLDPNDPRFTAKALGEAEPENISPEANEEFESLQDFAATLKSELKARDEKDALTAEQKERVRNAIEPQQKKTILKFPVWINAVAACLVLGLVGIIAFRATEESRKQPMLAENAVAEQSTGKGAVQPTTPGRRGDMEIPEIVVDLPEARDREADNSTVAGASENEIVDLEPYVLEDSLIVEYERPAAMTGNYVKRFDLPVDEADAELTTKFRSDEDAKDALDVSPPKPSEVVTFDMKQESKEGYVATSTLGGTSPSEGRMKQPVPASQPRRASSATLRQEPERILSYTDTPTTLLNLKR